MSFTENETTKERATGMLDAKKLDRMTINLQKEH